MPEMQEEKNQLLDLATNFNDFTKKNGWVSRYDIESDAFSIAVPKLSEDARIKYFDNEVAFYITNDNKVEGVFLEYFKTNFIKHHSKSKKIEKVLNDLEKKQKDDESLVTVSMSQMKDIAPDLEKAIRISLASRLDLSPCL
jgi:hypothetical protein